MAGSGGTPETGAATSENVVTAAESAVRVEPERGPSEPRPVGRGGRVVFPG